MTARPTLRIRSAGNDDLPRVLDVLVPAVASTELARWLHPNAASRGRHVKDGIDALVSGPASEVHVRVAEAGPRIVGSAVWTPCRAPRPGLFDWGLAPVDGPDGPRTQQLETVVSRRHPRTPHDHLLVLGVAPDRQGAGLGTALLADWLSRPWNAPSYLLATDAMAGLAHRLGYRAVGQPIRPQPGAPALRPMWRAENRDPQPDYKAEAGLNDVYWPTNSDPPRSSPCDGARPAGCRRPRGTRSETPGPPRGTGP